MPSSLCPPWVHLGPPSLRNAALWTVVLNILVFLIEKNIFDNNCECEYNMNFILGVNCCFKTVFTAGEKAHRAQLCEFTCSQRIRFWDHVVKFRVSGCPREYCFQTALALMASMMWLHFMWLSASLWGTNVCYGVSNAVQCVTNYTA